MDKAEVGKLAGALISDIENNTLPIELLVAKALRLAQLIGDSEAAEWLSYEMNGYDLVDNPSDVAQKFAQLTRRADLQRGKGFANSAADIAQALNSLEPIAKALRDYQPTGLVAPAENARRFGVRCNSTP
jgi:hypothetical protein